MDLRNKKVTVVGLGNSGLGSALLLLNEGAIVSVTDKGDNDSIRKNAELLRSEYIDVETGRHTEGFLSESEIMVISPSVEKDALPVRYARANNIPLISELELGYLFCRGTIAAITGTNGKSTVVSLIGNMLREAGMPVNVCGNIGNSLSGEVYAASIAGEKSGKTIYVVETSSFQLELTDSFRPKISAILNVTEDHLDRHPDFEDYFAAKKRIFKNQKKGDHVILNYDDESLRKLGKRGAIEADVLYFSRKRKVEGAYLEKGNIKMSRSDKVKKLFKLPDSRLKGAHNEENILASVLTATLLGARSYLVETALKNFAPLRHRIEKVATIGNIEFIDDSKATNIDSTYRALESMERPSILIAGGKEKNLSYEKVLPVVKKNVKKIVLIGETKPRMRKIFEKYVAVEECDTLPEAVFAAYKSASPGDSVLLSPMCSSFDMFRSYEHRSEVFREAVEKIKKCKP